MESVDKLEARVLAKLDQAWAMQASFLSEIERVAMDGPSMPEDEDLVKGALKVICAEIHFRKALLL